MISNPCHHPPTENGHSSIKAIQRETLLDAMSEIKHYHKLSKMVEERIPTSIPGPSDRHEAILEHVRTTMAGPKHHKKREAL